MINFLKYRTITAVTSACLFVAFFGVALYRYHVRGNVFQYSIEFTGGTQIHLAFDKEVDSARIKEIISGHGWENPTVLVLENNEILVRIKEFENDAKALSERMRDVLVQGLPGYHVTVSQIESVGAGVGAELRWKSIYAVLASMVMMLLYIALRFWSLGFAVGAVAALFHDAIVMLAVFLFLDREISLNVIAAILAVLGYSINDTIVIFSQIREYLKKMKDVSIEDVVTMGLNHTLRRTLLISFATGLPVMMMFLFGGEALRDFSLVLLVGIIFGTYSSIYIASPIMMLLQPATRSR